MRKLIIIFFLLPISIEAQEIINVDSIRIFIEQKDSSNIIEVCFQNLSKNDIHFNTCFDYQSNGEFGGSDITILVKLDTLEKIPIANFYSKKNCNCYVKLSNNDIFKQEIDFDTFFKDNFNILRIKEIKVKIFLTYFKGKIIKNNLYEETGFYKIKLLQK